MSGGMSHLDTFDPKPEASSEIRGDLSTIKTSADGVRVSEYLQGLRNTWTKSLWLILYTPNKERMSKQGI